MEKNADKQFNSLEGRILVASPNLDDTYFEKSLVYLCAHDIDGAIGVMINHKIGAISAEELAKFIQTPASQQDRQDKVNKEFPVLFGGPVYTDKVVVLCVNKQKAKLFKQQSGVTLYTDLENFLQEYSNGNLTQQLLFAKGVAVWESNQLEEEIESNAWFLVSATKDLLFSQRIKHKWSSVIKKLGIENFCNLVSYSGRA